MQQSSMALIYVQYSYPLYKLLGQAASDLMLLHIDYWLHKAAFDATDPVSCVWNSV